MKNIHARNDDMGVGTLYISEHEGIIQIYTVPILDALTFTGSGGRSLHTLKALRSVFDAMRKDQKESPQENIIDSHDGISRIEDTDEERRGLRGQLLTSRYADSKITTLKNEALIIKSAEKGGKSPDTYAALLGVLQAMPQDEKEFPQAKENSTYKQRLFTKGLGYEEKRRIMEDYLDDIADDMTLQKKIEQANVFWNLLTEILENAVDHTDGDIDTMIEFQKHKEKKEYEIYFKIADNGPGFDLSQEELLEAFKTGNTKNRTKKGKNNYGIGFQRIPAVAQTLNVDLLLHNRGSYIHIHDIGLQKEKVYKKPEKKCTYEGRTFLPYKE